MAITNKICQLCGKQYQYCNSCPADDKNPTFMNMFCSESCKNLFMAASDFYAGDISKDQAKKIVKNANLSRQANFKDSVKKFLKDITDNNQEVKKENFSKSVNVKNSFKSNKNNETKEISEVLKISEDK